MPEFSFISTVFVAICLPFLAMASLLASKLASPTAARRAERRFLSMLIVMTLVTAHTVAHADAAWLIHTVTLSMMVVGALLVPSHSLGPASAGTSPFADPHSV
ncbi:MAG: hypothetical protein AAGD07_22780 [Planctomycetota bacterium]